jgi:hypothetical protein
MAPRLVGALIAYHCMGSTLDLAEGCSPARDWTISSTVLARSWVEVVLAVVGATGPQGLWMHRRHSENAPSLELRVR